jgi:hypothetical protein
VGGMTPAQEERDHIIDDLAEDVIQVAWMVDKRGGHNPQCEICGWRQHQWYRVYVETPSTVLDEADTRNMWGRVCFGCMAMIVAAKGTPVPCKPVQK